MFLLIFSVLLIAFGVYRFKTGQKKLVLPPGPKGLPVVGNLFQVSRRPYETYSKWMEDFGDFYHLKFASDHVFVMSDSALIRECFNNPIFQGRSEAIFTSVLSRGKNGVVLSDGPTWTEQRRFTLRHLRDFGFGKNYMESLIMEEVNDLIQAFKEEEGQPIDMDEKFTLPVINSLWMIIAGRKFKHDDHDKLDLLLEIDRTFAKLTITNILFLLAPSILNLAPELLGYNRAIRVRDRLHEMLKEVIKEHEVTLPEDGSSRDFIDAFLHEIKNTKDDSSSFYKESGITQLLAGIGDLFFAGSETTSATLKWTILYLAVHQNVQKKIHTEIDSVVGKSRPVSLADKPNLVYVEATIQEILRKSSIVVTGVFHMALEDSTFNGYDIPKGSWLVANQYALHHKKSLWRDPENFRPERFLSADGKKVVKGDNVVAFSVGRRACLGESLARDTVYLFLTNIFQRFHVQVETVKGQHVQDVASLDPKEGFILQPQDYRVILTDRLA